VVVDLLHGHGTVPGVAVEELQASDPAATRPVLSLADPRCADCGRPLTRRELGRRIARGGDLFDRRFLWSR